MRFQRNVMFVKIQSCLVISFNSYNNKYIKLFCTTYKYIQEFDKSNLSCKGKID